MTGSETDIHIDRKVVAGLECRTGLEGDRHIGRDHFIFRTPLQDHYIIDAFSRNIIIRFP